MIKRTFWSIST